MAVKTCIICGEPIIRPGCWVTCGKQKCMEKNKKKRKSQRPEEWEKIYYYKNKEKKIIHSQIKKGVLIFPMNELVKALDYKERFNYHIQFEGIKDEQVPHILGKIFDGDFSVDYELMERGVVSELC